MRPSSRTRCWMWELTWPLHWRSPICCVGMQIWDSSFDITVAEKSHCLHFVTHRQMLVTRIRRYYARFWERSCYWSSKNTWVLLSVLRESMLLVIREYVGITLGFEREHVTGHPRIRGHYSRFWERSCYWSSENTWALLSVLRESMLLVIRAIHSV